VSRNEMTSPDYSSFAKEYAQSRPRYPTELFSYLASLVKRRRLAWDCATGNGQAALELVKHFERVIATDVSAEQIHQATPHPQIEYRVAKSEQSGLDDRSADLVTVASAIHWFDLNVFYSEARRVMQPGGLLAAWAYHVGHVEPPFDQIFKRFYFDVIYPYFAPGARLVDQRYETLTLPGEALNAGEWWISAAWNLDQMLAFIASWSGTQRYIKERGEDPVALIAGELEHIWGERKKIHVVRWPLYIRISRL
jgi:SAM-dependent methyltransferase